MQNRLFSSEFLLLKFKKDVLSKNNRSSLGEFPHRYRLSFSIESLTIHHPKISPIGKNKILDKIVSSPPRSNRIQTLALKTDRGSKPILKSLYPLQVRKNCGKVLENPLLFQEIT